MSFYDDEIEPTFRFGDVVQGFQVTTPTFDQPMLQFDQFKYRIDVYNPYYCVILTPCCSIDGGIITLVPLIKIWNSFYKNPYFEEDFTRINRVVANPENSVSSAQWKHMSQEEKSIRLGADPDYTLYNLFIYEPNDLFPKYPVDLSGRDNPIINYYMVDFKNVYQVNCPLIKKPNNVPIESKRLQLSIDTRKELRDKIAYYYGRTPAEDQ